MFLFSCEIIFKIVDNGGLNRPNVCVCFHTISRMIIKVHDFVIGLLK